MSMLGKSRGKTMWKLCYPMGFLMGVNDHHDIDFILEWNRKGL